MDFGFPVRPGSTHAQLSNSERINLQFVVRIVECYVVSTSITISGKNKKNDSRIYVAVLIN